MTSVTLTFGRERQEAQKFKVVLSYVLSCLKKKKKPLGFCDLHNWRCLCLGALLYSEKNLLLELPTTVLLLLMGVPQLAASVSFVSS